MWMKEVFPNLSSCKEVTLVLTTSTAKNSDVVEILEYNEVWDSWGKIMWTNKGSRQRKTSFYGQADRKGGEGSAPSALTVSKCGNFGPIFPIIKW